MADRGRDLKVSILSDVDKFDVDAPARDLEQLADKATKSGKRIDDAFDKIGKSSKQMGKQVDAGTDKAGAALDDFKGESASTARESAASFTGSFDDVAGSIQEVAANAFGGFGPAGAAAGLAAAAGIGLATAALTKSADEANALKDRVIEMTAALADVGGDVSRLDLDGMMREWSLEIADNKSWWELWQKANTTNLEKVEAQANETGLAFDDLFKGMSGTDSAAAKRVLEDLNDKLEENAKKRAEANRQYDDNIKGSSVLIRNLADERIALEDVRDQLEKNSPALADAIRLEELQARAMGLSREAYLAKIDTEQRAAEAARATVEASRAAGETIEGFVDPLNAYTDALDRATEKEQKRAEATAAGTKDSKDKWEDYARDVDVSLKAVNQALEEQVEAQREWAENLQKLAKRGVDDGVLSELARMGPEGAALVAELATSSKPELDKWAFLMAQKGAQGQDEFVRNLVAGTPNATAAGAALGAGAAEGVEGQRAAMSTAARALLDGADNVLSRGVQLPVTLERRFNMSDLERLRNDIRNRVGTIVVPVRAGQSPYSNTSSNSRYRE